MSLNAIVNRIIRAREEAGMSQMELSRKIGAVSNTIQKVESGFIKNPEKYVPDVAKALQKPLSYFFGEDNPELTAFAEKAKKFDELSSLIQASGILAGGGDSNVVVNGHANHIVVNPDTKRLIEEIMQKDKEEREMILRILELEKDEKEKLLQLYEVINKGKKFEEGDADQKGKKKTPRSK
jgi:transcriptional regulator with XRE-family HTH domain